MPRVGIDGILGWEGPTAFLTFGPPGLLRWPVRNDSRPAPG